MLAETERIIHQDIDFLPLKSYTNIKEGNALRVPWDEWEIDEKNPVVIANHTVIYPKYESRIDVAGEPVVQYENLDLYSSDIELRTTPKEPRFRHVEFDYIMGNPPFV